MELLKFGQAAEIMVAQKLPVELYPWRLALLVMLEFVPVSGTKI